MAGKDPGKFIFAGRIAEQHGPAAFERTAAVPGVVSAESLERVIVRQDRFECPADKILLSRRVGIAKPLAEDRAVEGAQSSRHAIVTSVIPRMNQLGLLRIGEGRAEFLDQLFGRSGLRGVSSAAISRVDRAPPATRATEPPPTMRMKPRRLGDFK
jgi:hypothetical protein